MAPSRPSPDVVDLSAELVTLVETQWAACALLTDRSLDAYVTSLDRVKRSRELVVNSLELLRYGTRRARLDVR